MGVLWDQWFTPADAETIKYKVRTIIGRDGYRASDAEDLEQRLAIRAWKAMHLFRPTQGTRSTYLKTVLNHEVASIIEHDTASKRDRRQERPIEAAGDGPVINGNERQAGEDRRLDLADMVARLPKDLRPTAQLLMVMSPADVARQPGMTPGKVRQKAARIRRFWRELGWEFK